MTAPRSVVLTGVGVVSPIGIGRDAFWDSLCAGRSGVRTLPGLEPARSDIGFGGQILGFDPKLYVTPRKSLKVMSQEIQWAFACARMACDQAGITMGSVDPDRMGVVFGADMIYGEVSELVPAYLNCLDDGEFEFSRWGTQALAEIHPLWLLKYLPNMPACHVAIAHDARGPNNSVTIGNVSSLVAIGEAVRLIERGAADIVVTGGASYTLNPLGWSFRYYRHSHRCQDPSQACRPFDADRDGAVWGDGAAALVLESAQHAESRRARVLARVLSCANACEPHSGGPLRGTAIRHVIRKVLDDARLDPRDVGHINAHGLSTVEHDRVEAQAIRSLLDQVPVTAPKSFFGNLGAAGGAVEAVASILAFEHGQIPPTLNYERADPECPINVVRDQPAPLGTPTALLLNQNTTGQAAAVVLAGADAGVGR